MLIMQSFVQFLFFFYKVWKNDYFQPSVQNEGACPVRLPSDHPLL